MCSSTHLLNTLFVPVCSLAVLKSVVTASVHKTNASAFEGPDGKTTYDLLLSLAEAAYEQPFPHGMCWNPDVQTLESFYTLVFEAFYGTEASTPEHASRNAAQLFRAVAASIEPSMRKYFQEWK